MSSLPEHPASDRFDRFIQMAIIAVSVAGDRHQSGVLVPGRRVDRALYRNGLVGLAVDQQHRPGVPVDGLLPERYS